MPHLPSCLVTSCRSAAVAGEGEIPGLTDENKPKMRGPKRASKIRKLYNLNKEDDVREYVKLHGRKIEKDGKSIIKVPKIQRLVTPAALQRKRRRAAQKKQRIANVRLPSFPTHPAAPPPLQPLPQCQWSASTAACCLCSATRGLAQGPYATGGPCPCQPYSPATAEVSMSTVV